MNQIEAFKETLNKCRADWPPVDEPYLSLSHHEDMLARIVAGCIADAPTGFSSAKLDRWLGWLQGVPAALGLLTLDECKAINQKWADAPRNGGTP